MTEEEVIRRTMKPVTRRSLRADLHDVGVEAGTTLLVHASLSALGWVCGGPVAVVLALLDVLGEDGTLVVPTHTNHLSDPSFWCQPAVPTNWWQEIRDNLPAFDPLLTPSRRMGCIAETVRQLPGSLRSQHPQWSFTAYGPQASFISNNHQLDAGLGEGSPLARIYDVCGDVLLFGVGHDRNTSLHLAEYRRKAAAPRPVVNAAPVYRDGRRQWIEIRDHELHKGDFPRVGQAFAKSTGYLRTGRVGEATALLMPQRELVDFASRWFDKHR